MFKHDDGDGVGVLAIIIVFFVIVYLVALLATLIATFGALGGIIFGGGSAIKNYILSFKENIIDSTKKPIMSA